MALLGGREARARGGRGAVRVWARVSRSRCIVAGRRHRGGGRRWERGGAPCLRRGWGGGGRAPHSCTRTLPPPIHRPAPRSPPLHAPLERRPAAACTDGGPGRLAQAACIADCAGSDRRGLHQGHAHADRVAGHAVPAGECGGGAGGGRECVCESVLGGRPRTGPLLARAWSRPVASHPPTHPPTHQSTPPPLPLPARPLPRARPTPTPASAGLPARRWGSCAQTWDQTCRRSSTRASCPRCSPSWTTLARRACRHTPAPRWSTLQVGRQRGVRGAGRAVQLPRVPASASSRTATPPTGLSTRARTHMHSHPRARTRRHPLTSTRIHAHTRRVF